MNWKKLQEMQKALDESIIKNKNLELTEKERWDSTLVALTNELGEVIGCDEKCFKFWKDNKGKVDEKRFYSIPRTQREGVEKPRSYEDLRNNGKLCTFEEAHHLSLVEECSDCLHFILSIANQAGISLDTSDTPFYKKWSLQDTYLIILGQCCNLRGLSIDELGILMIKRRFLVLCELLGVTQDELEQAYYEKNKVNYERLANGY